MGLRRRLRKGLESVFGARSPHIQMGAKNEVSTANPTAIGQTSVVAVHPHSAEQRLRDIPTNNVAYYKTRDGKTHSENEDTTNRTESLWRLQEADADMGALKNAVEDENIRLNHVTGPRSEHEANPSVDYGKSEMAISKQRNSDTENTVTREDTVGKERAKRTISSTSGSSNNAIHSLIVDHNNDNHAPPTTSRQPHVGILNGLQSAWVSGGTFTVQNIMSSERPGFKLLRERVATSAFHNSAQRVDPPRCHPDTRIAILQKIYDWITQSTDREKWLLWLNGAAGAGKSAIIQSIAERCARTAIAIASFFFFRVDSTRNTIAPLVATLAYQLMQVMPETSEDILLTIERNPLIFDQSFESQLLELLIQPLLRLPAHLQRLFVVFIDGLDECNDRDHQSNLITVLGNVLRNRSCPIIFLVSSRREPQIEAEFVHDQRSGLVMTLPLDNSDVEQTSDDIRRFLTDKFNNIRQTHLRRQLLPTDWPPMSGIEEIVSKSSGQFIYASVVVKYVSSPRANPARQFDIIRGIRLRDASSQNPFAHLDALYQHIFSQVDALDIVLNILAYVMITKRSNISQLEDVFLLEAGELEVYLADLTAVIECKLADTTINSAMKFLHASLPDFLRDKSRSENYHIDVNEYQTNLLCMLLDRVPPMRDPLSQTITANRVVDQEVRRIYGISSLLNNSNNPVKPSDQLQRSFMNFDFTFYYMAGDVSPAGPAMNILKSLKKLDFGDRSRVYDHVLEAFAVEFARVWQSLSSSTKSLIKDSADLSTRIGQILQNEV